MAPFQGPSRDDVIAALQKRRPPADTTLGKYEPQARLWLEDGVWRLARFRINQARADGAGQAALARGENWMPEMTWQFKELEPPLFETRSKDELIAHLAAMDWPFGP